MSFAVRRRRTDRERPLGALGLQQEESPDELDELVASLEPLATLLLAAQDW